ncbi:GntR family transcriptional regulator [uncultured Polaribacter sp.]|uniref:FadR/GntR family transcriptional regulator n=1 Tax=uncultured Polaribacter sp. TaxID=174711 RepID=UPI002610BDEB|nr:GntR family transcriptional regulator [uncultured Polaribacter sp.]
MDKVKIKPVLKESMVDQVENNLRSFIREKGFKPGDTLPTENELATSMNVSRNVVREALSRFRMLGLISSNKKKGIQLLNFDIFPALERVLDPTVMSKDTLHELFELRIMLEIGMADALFRNVTKEEIDFLYKMIVSYESNENKEQTKIDYEIDFHSYLYKITKNRTLCGFQKYLKVVFDYVLNLEANTNLKNIPVKKVNHLELVQCLENGTIEEFRQKMHDHFNPYAVLGIFLRNQSTIED